MRPWLRMGPVVVAALTTITIAACGSPRRSESLGDTFAPASPIVAHGERLFMEHCNFCHPGGAAGLGPSLNDKPLPAFMIRTQVRAGRGAMPAFSPEDLSPADLEAVIAYVSALAARARDEALASLAAAGTLEFLFLAPEQLGNPEVLEPLRAAQPSLFVVDEAHCISQWGHDFRPDYLKLGAVIDALGRPTILALTTTVSPRVRDDITRHLGMRKPHVLVHGFDRPNLFLAVRTFATNDEKPPAVLTAVKEADKPGIVYAATRKHTEELTAELAARGVRAVAYHAGLRRAARDAIHTAFMSGDEDVIVATSAFGMGVDKPTGASCSTTTPATRSTRTIKRSVAAAATESLRAQRCSTGRRT